MHAVFISTTAGAIQLLCVESGVLGNEPVNLTIDIYCMYPQVFDVQVLLNHVSDCTPAVLSDHGRK